MRQTINNQLKEKQQSTRTTIKMPSDNSNKDGAVGDSDGDSVCVWDSRWQASSGWQASGGWWQQKKVENDNDVDAEQTWVG